MIEGNKRTWNTLERALRKTPGTLSSSPAPTASVALIFTPEMTVLMIKRAERRSDPWSGQMAFPGGKIEPADRSPQDTAERETNEEVGIDLKTGQARLLGRLDDQVTPWLTISAFVYGIQAKSNLIVNAEVSSAHWLPFEDLMDKNNRTKINFKRGKTKGRYPAVRLHQQTIWGISLRFIDELHSKLT